jgi:hypothetical protein
MHKMPNADSAVIPRRNHASCRADWNLGKRSENIGSGGIISLLVVIVAFTASVNQ